MSSETLRRAAELAAASDLIYITKRSDRSVLLQSFRALDRWERRYETFAHGLLQQLVRKVPLQEIVEGERGGFLKRYNPDAERVADRIKQRVEAEALEGGAVAGYVDVALDIGDDAGQYTLDALGLNKTFRWAHRREMGRDLYGVRGSKIIQRAYGSHIDKLAEIIVRATDPRHPKTIQDVMKEIRQEWPQVTRKQAERIARTETATIWEITKLNTHRANGIEQFKWLVASGPSIGVTVGPVCPTCLRRGAYSPYHIEQLIGLQHAEIGAPAGVPNGPPPVHPNCRCTLVPLLVNWLPPKQPWAGADLPLDEMPGMSLLPAPPTDRWGTLQDMLELNELDIKRVFRGYVPPSMLERVFNLKGVLFDQPMAGLVAGIRAGSPAVVAIKDLIATVPAIGDESIPDVTTIVPLAGAYYVLTGHENVAQQAASGATEVNVMVVEVEH